MAKTKIEWTDVTWNPVTGCSPISEGCQNCYARRMAYRLRGRYGYNRAKPFRVTLHPERIAEPLRWKKPQRIFVCSMSDLFHEDVPFGYIARVFGMMHTANQHAYLVLTKRPQRMMEFFEWFVGLVWRGAWPKEYQHVWLGVTAENQKRADERIPVLLQVPAAKRFVSVEPMLDEIGLGLYLPGIDWVIAGGETGPKARPLHPDWVRLLRDQCFATETPFFFKSWGEFIVPEDGARQCRVCGCTEHNACEGGCWWVEHDLCSACVGKPTPRSRAVKYQRVGRKAAGRLLDGRTWDESPQMR